MKKTISENGIFAGLLITLVALVYGQFLFNPAVFDDANFFLPGSGDVSRLGAFSPLQIRWLPYATIAWTVGAVNENIPWLRFEALLLHAAVGSVLFFLLQNLYRQIPVLEGSEKSVPLYAFCSACLFVLHPVAVYGAGYLIQRTVVMATLFSLLGIWAYLHGSVRKNPLWLWVSVPSYYLAVLSKEHAVMLPAVLLAMTILLHDDWRSKLKQRWAIYFAFVIIAIFVIAAKKGLLGSVYEINAPEMLDAGSSLNYPLSVLTQAWLFFKYLGLWLLPNPAWMSVDMREPFATGFFSIYGLSALAFIGYGLFAILLLFRRGAKGVIGLAMLFPWLLFFTEFSTVRIQEPFVLYRSYLWMAGIFIALPLLLGRIKVTIATPLALVVMLIFCIGTVNRLTTFSDPLLLWNDAAKLVEQKHGLLGVWRIYLNRAKYLLEHERTQQALFDYQLALSIAPQVERKLIYQGLGGAYLQYGNYPAAASSFDKVIELGGDYEHARYGRGLAYLMMGKGDAARNDLTVVCKAGRRVACDKLELLTDR